jgi:hypothetical protein
MRFFSSFLRIIGLCAAALLLASCSAVRLGYNQLPDLTYWWLDSYIDTADAQTPRLRREIDALHQWHRASELPEYAHLLQKMQRLAPGPVTPEQACALFDEMRGRFDVLSARLEAPAVWLAQSLTPAQINHLALKFGKTNAEWQDKWLRGTAPERLERRLKQTVERYELLYGTLDPAQTEMLRTALARAGDPAPAWWAERLRRQQDILRTLRQLSAGNLPPEAARASLHALLGRLTTAPDPAVRAASDAALRENCAVFARVHNASAPTQRARAVETLKNYEADFRTLAATP